jgi:hypothetical protein
MHRAHALLALQRAESAHTRILIRVLDHHPVASGEGEAARALSGAQLPHGVQHPRREADAGRHHQPVPRVVVDRNDALGSAMHAHERGEDELQLFGQLRDRRQRGAELVQVVEVAELTT